MAFMIEKFLDGTESKFEESEKRRKYKQKKEKKRIRNEFFGAVWKGKAKFIDETFIFSEYVSLTGLKVHFSFLNSTFLFLTALNYYFLCFLTEITLNKIRKSIFLPFL